MRGSFVCGNCNGDRMGCLVGKNQSNGGHQQAFHGQTKQGPHRQQSSAVQPKVHLRVRHDAHAPGIGQSELVAEYCGWPPPLSITLFCIPQNSVMLMAITSRLLPPAHANGAPAAPVVPSSARLHRMILPPSCTTGVKRAYSHQETDRA